MRITSSVLTILSLVSMLGSFGCTGYQFGTNTLYNTEIRNVYVPVFESNSYRQNLGVQLTEAVKKRISERTPYEITNNPATADSILSGHITNESQTVTLVDDYNGTRQKKIEYTVLVQWKNRRGSTMGTMSPIIWNDTPTDITTNSDMVAEMGHSYATASQEAIDKMADQIVDMMAVPW